MGLDRVLNMQAEKTEVILLFSTDVNVALHQSILRDANQQGRLSDDRAGAAAGNTAVLRSQVKRYANTP